MDTKVIERLTKEDDTLDYVDSIYYKEESDSLTIVTRRDLGTLNALIRKLEYLEISGYNTKMLPLQDTTREGLGECIYEWESATLQTVPFAARHRWLENPRYAKVVETALSLMDVIIIDFASAFFNRYRDRHSQKHDALHLFIKSDISTKEFVEREMNLQRELLQKFDYDDSRFLHVYRLARIGEVSK